MDAERFIETLDAIGCPSATNISTAAIDWMFSDAELAPFLRWFSTEVSTSSVLKPEEIKRYAELTSSSDTLLDGASKISTSVSVRDSDDIQSLRLTDPSPNVTDDQLRQEVEQLEEALGTMRRRRDTLSRQKERLSEHQSSMTDRISFLESESVTLRGAEQQQLKACDRQNSDLNACLKNLADSVAELSEHYQVLSEPENRSEPLKTGLLSHLNLDKFLEAEQKYSEEITNFTRKQFFDGIAEIAKKADGTRYEFLEVNKPETWLVQGDSDTDYTDNCRDLARISSTYVSSEMDRVRAKIDECSMSAAVDYYETMAAKLRVTPLPADQASLSGRLKEAECQHKRVNKDLVNLAEVHLPQLLEKNSSLQNISILQGDYDLKLTRQQYFTSNQDKLIEQLIGQKSHGELLTMMLEIELCQHRDVRRLVTAITLFLNEIHTAFHHRLTWLTETGKACDYKSRTTIDSRDKFILRLHDILETIQLTSAAPQFEGGAGGASRAGGGASRAVGTRDQRLFVSYDLLNRAALHAATYLFPHDTSRPLLDESDKLSTLEKSVSSCENVLYEGGSCTEPIFTPRQLEESMSRLSNILCTLEQAARDVMKDIEQKKKILQKDPLLSIERELFVYFHNDPQRLREIFNQVVTDNSSV